MAKMLCVLYCSLLLAIVTAQDELPQDPLFTNGIQQVWQGNTILYEALFGHANRENDIVMTSDAQFRIGSNSKTFTTMAILQLSERIPSLFSIYDNISDHLTPEELAGWGYEGGSVYCPKFNGTDDACQPLSFYDLMTMRSGLVNALGCFNYQPGSWPTQYCADEAMFLYYRGSTSDTIKWFSNVPLLTQPGSTYNYNNGNTIMLSFFVEKFSGLKLEDYMHTYLFEPLGLHSTSQDNLAEQFEANARKVQSYYDYTDLTTGSFEYFAYGNAAATVVQAGVQSGAGGFISTAHDMVKFYTSLFVTKNVSHVVSDAALALMIEPKNIVQNHPDFGCDVFGAGFFMVYQTCNALSDVTTRNYIYYQGVVNSATATILVMDDWSAPDAGAGSRIVATGLRNNAIVDTTQSNWLNAKLDSGNRTALFEKYNMFESSDSWHITWQNALYFQAHPVPYSTTDGDAEEVACSSSDDEEASTGVLVGSMFAAAACVVLAVVKAGGGGNGGGGGVATSTGVASTGLASTENQL